MASLQQQLDIYIRNAPISAFDKESRIREIRKYLDEIEALVKSLPSATDMAVSRSDLTLEPLSTKPDLIATVAAVSEIPSPFRSLLFWTPVIEHNGEWMTWRGENYGAVPDSLKAAQEVVKALAKVQYLIRRTCTTDDIVLMCPEVVPLAGGTAAVTNLLRPHIANLKNRSKAGAQKLWISLEKKVSVNKKGLNLWNQNSALILFSHLAATIDFHYLTGPGLNTIAGYWAAYIYKDFYKNMSAGLDLEFMDGCPARALIAGLVVPSPQDVPLTSSIVFPSRSSRQAMMAISSPSPTVFDPPADNDSTPSIAEMISAVRSCASASDKRFTTRIHKKGTPKRHSLFTA